MTLNRKSPAAHFLLIFFVALLVLPTAASSQVSDPSSGLEDPEVTLYLEGQMRSALRLAMPAMQGVDRLSPEMTRAAQELERTLRADLQASGVFVVQGPVELSVLQLTGDPQRDFELYRSLRNELLLTTEVKQEPGRIVLEGRVFDLKSGEVALGKRYRGVPAVARRIAHTFADEIVLFFSGRPGIALTSIAFYSDRNGHKEVYLMDADGSNQRPITAHQSISLSPTWSPARQEIAYVSYFSGVPGIYLVDVETGGKTPVLTSGNLNISPSFSPDGKRIVFARSVGAGNTEIFVCDRDGTNLRQLTHSSGIDTNPEWSPSGQRIAFTSSRTGSPQVYLMDAEGANLRRVTFDGDYNDGASWSPDGTRLVYASRRRGTFDVAIADVVTLESRLLTNGGGSHETPSFSPDGKRIVFTTKRAAGRENRTQIYTMDAGGGNLRQVTREGNNFGPAWSGFFN
jgi:TolB protein